MAPTNSDSTAINRRAPASVEGAITRKQESRTRTIFMDPDNAPSRFGFPMKRAADDLTLYGAIETGDAAADFVGFITRDVPSDSGTLTGQDSLQSGVPNPLYPWGLLIGGFMGAKCKVGTPARGDHVFMRVVADAPKEVGDLEATSDVTAADGAMVGTGNATIADVTPTVDAEAGVYNLLMTAATKFNVESPSGVVLKQGTLGVAYSAGGISFTATAGVTPAVAGDTIAITVTKKNVRLDTVVWALDGKDENDNSEVEFVAGQ